jgi:hypothetical protein
VDILDASGMQSVTAYAPIRIVALGILKVIFGLLVGVIGAVLVVASWTGDMAPRQPGDLPPWWMMVVGSVLAFVAFSYVAGGVGRMISAFAGDCYFKAGPAGVAIRKPQQGWFGRFRMVEYRFKWEEIKQLVHFTHRINLIPVSRELRIEPREGKTVVVERFYFSESIKEIQRRLLAVQASAGR